MTINSTTKLLPAYKRHLKGLSLPVRAALRVALTRWNAVYDLVEYSYEYRNAIDKFMAMKENGMRELELSEDEWELVRQLWDVLQVRVRASRA